MKLRQITLQQCDNDDDLYIVAKLVDCIEPKAGSVLKPREVEALIAKHNLKVTILRAAK